MRLFKNGKIATEASPELVDADVLVNEDGVIVEVGPSLKGGDAKVSDCSGCVIVPGMFDLHVRGREPGFEHKETLETCAAAALHGGITGVVLMPDTSPPIDSSNQLKSIQDRIAELGSIEMLQSGCLTKGRAGKELAGYSGLAALGVPMLTDSDRSIDCPDLLRRCMEYARDFDLLVTSHCETPALAKAGVVSEGKLSYRLGLPGMPAISQEIAIVRDLALARHTGVRLHLQQISTGMSLDAVRLAKQAGVRVSCEVSPHHLILSEDDITNYDTAFKIQPPLQKKEHNEALLAGLLDDTIDVIASGHAPHTAFEKSADFGSAPWGASALETAVPAIYDRFIRTGKFNWDLLIRKYSSGPRRLMRLEPVAITIGEKANFFVFDVEAETKISLDYFRSKCSVSPFVGQAFQGQIRETIA